VFSLSIAPKVLPDADEEVYNTSGLTSVWRTFAHSVFIMLLMV